ncbi:MAG: DUF6565 domain-containing protein [Bacteroidales bacterium]
MRSKLFCAFLIAISSLALFSCDKKMNKETYLEKFTSFIDEVSLKEKDFTEEQWKKADKIFTALADTDNFEFKDTLTVAEKKEIGKLKGKYVVMRAKSGFRKAKKEVKEIMDQTEGFLDSILDELKDSGVELEKMIK